MIAPAVTRQTQTEWFASWFDSLHYHRLYADRDDHEAAVLVDRLIARLHPTGDASILDLGCGAGRHANTWRRKDST
jgi:SAM-dependent methyltransferase